MTVPVHGQPGTGIRFDWGLAGAAELGRVCAALVVVDVLSFTTSVEVAVSRGMRVHPFPWGEQAAEWFDTVKGVEWVSEKSRIRCEKCTQLRLEITALKAKQGGYDAFATTLSVSPHKDADLINRIGLHAATVSGVPFLEADYKQEGGFQRSIEMSREQDMYRQNYCGCVFSRLERKRYAKIKA